MRINNNIMAMNTYRQLSVGSTAVSKSMEKLSSGYRINRAGDDAAGLAISEKMRGQIRGLNMASRNAQDGISLIQTAEGALQETHTILQRMRELAVQASNDTYEVKDRSEIQKEIDQLKEEIDRIASTTEFNTMKLLNGDRANTKQVTGVNFQGSGDTTVNAASTGLNVKLLPGEDALSVGDHTLEVTVTRNTRADINLTPLANDLGGTGNGKGVIFTGDSIIADAAALADGWTLVYNSANNNFTLTNASSTVNDTIEIGQAYNNHGLSFTIEDSGTIGNGETLTFSTAGGDEAIGTNVVGWTSGTAKDATFNGAIQVRDDQELINYGGGTIEITLNADSGGSATVVVMDKGGNTVIEDVMTGTGVYNAHGITFEITDYGTTDGDKITINIANDTHKVEASLDGGAAKTIISDWNGVSTNAVSDFTDFAGIELDQSAVFQNGVFNFTVEQTVTGEDKSLTFQIGANSNQSMKLDITDMSASALQVDQVKVDNYVDAQAAIDSIEAAIGKVSAERSKLGAVQNRLEHTIRNLDTSAENLQASESRIRDVDMAKEMMEFTKQNILQQAATAMLAQANQAPQSVLQLLR
jgi:flagellin